MMIFKIYIKSEKEVVVFHSLKHGFAFGESGRRIMIVSPHDDDACIGSGLLIHQAIREEFDVRLVVVTRGDQGYCNTGDKDRIQGIRRLETLKAYKGLGIASDHLQFLGFPDCLGLPPEGWRLQTEAPGIVQTHLGRLSGRRLIWPTGREGRGSIGTAVKASLETLWR